MNQTWSSFLQTMIRWLRMLFTKASKKQQKNAALMTAGVSVITVIAFAAGDFPVGQSTALVAFAETSDYVERAEIELEKMELALSKMQDTKVNIENMHGEQDVQQEQAVIQEQGQNHKEQQAEQEKSENISTEAIALEEFQTENQQVELEISNEQPMEMQNAEESDAETPTFQTILSDSEHRILLRIVQAEAGGCDVVGKILVANVILNRMESDEFPDTVSEVVYQKQQFSPVMDGSIDTCKVTEETKQAVERALSGEDYSEGALYFMNRKRSSKKNVHWFDSHLDYLFRHGAHEFFK